VSTPDTLVLSAGYEPVDRISWQRAITLWWIDKVEIIEEYGDRVIRGADFAMSMPCVIRYKRAQRRVRRAVRFSRENVYLRDGGRCMYCGVGLALASATFDHVVPRRLGGATSWENVVIACLGCNQRKGGRLPAEAGMRLLVAPVKPRRLPSGPRERFVYADGMPEPWKGYLSRLSRDR